MEEKKLPAWLNWGSSRVKLLLVFGHGLGNPHDHSSGFLQLIGSRKKKYVE